MKRIIASRLTDPIVDGYPDKCRIEDAENGMVLLLVERFRTNPNPYKYDSDTNIELPWQRCYAQITPMEYKWECAKTPKRGKCLVLNGGGMCVTTLPNYNPDTEFPGTKTAYSVEIHCGFNRTWPGSSACQTVHPDDWSNFISHFELGEQGVYVLNDERTIKVNK